MYDLLMIWARMEPERCRSDAQGWWHVKRDGEWRMVSVRGEKPVAIAEDILVGTVLEALRERDWGYTVTGQGRFVIMAVGDTLRNAPQEENTARAYVARYLEALARDRLEQRKGV